MNVFQGIKYPEVIFETESQFNHKIQVIQIGAVKKIKVDGIDQSISHESKACKRLVWGQAVDLMKRENPAAKKVLIFGLGGGTMQHLISQSYPGIELVSVEIDSVMVDIAKKYFNLDLIPNHRVVVADAFRVVIEPETYNLDESSFDTVIIDVYQGEKFPDLGTSGNFFSALKKLILPNGLVIINRIYREDHQFDVDNFIGYVEKILRSVKSEIVAGYTNSDNVLIFGRN
ncbi:hypothetical protein JXA34_00715 [Patescibacteria group bacterium]|nr:hypothetical protein [Patescibacteria group bacterium]